MSINRTFANTWSYILLINIIYLILFIAILICFNQGGEDVLFSIVTISSNVLISFILIIVLLFVFNYLIKIPIKIVYILIFFFGINVLIIYLLTGEIMFFGLFQKYPDLSQIKDLAMPEWQEKSLYDSNIKRDLSFSLSNLLSTLFTYIVFIIRSNYKSSL